ncbi:LacI family DNA-binding transcriptional regulator [Burkholderia cenocepacia]|uniref:LacI family DNA-binding transcriptional regulator n=1 Tax=Burkholderia cepacia complex TaxID=87882 RepID=UPI000F5A35E8|nr:MULTISPECIES: LacI family DNA-binding transcriptional regulator [Burkholderia cepacia complex]ELW9447125.1 LacI family DNA-binding transcriptional regulator [Burkholderia cenocepacia]ELW9451715.1 LacI family DNA-binding transcriptional regulator [Burkholderia cenocepacia]MBR8481564.1 LacI family DNA-binding transcriptional regulator [Burkholderia cenocepacia]MDN7466500.1 LacI family DNA-binding transcriptional regulator [Burkholderia orbicola]MDN7501965.1 LacI family DNA-binding transcripti
MKKGANATIRDVAMAAEVSVATVSKYVNGTKRFSPEVEFRLKQTIEKLGYQTSPLARSMITGRTRTIGLVILDISNPHFASVVKGANRTALAHDYTLLLVDTEEDAARERSLIEALAQRVDGLIISSRLSESEAGWMLDLKKPVVMLRHLDELSIPTVGIDNRLATYMLARHLLDLGHRKIAYLGFGQASIDAERIRGASECLAEEGLALDVFDAHAPTSIAGEEACSRVLLGPRRPHAVICYNDLIALGFMKCAKTLGFQVPRDIAITGIDNAPYGQYSEPALTTVDTQSEKMGELATLKVFEALAGRHDGERVLLEPRLVVRESAANRTGPGPR